MKRFILKSLSFVVPFALCYIVTSLFYSDTEAPDLLRLGYFPKLSQNYISDADIARKHQFDKLSEATGTSYKILTIGDSFSEQDGYGYRNNLAEQYSVLHVDRFISKNQFQTLIDLINGDFFKTHEIEYVILQGVERQLIKNVSTIDYKSELNQNSLDSIIKNYVSRKENYQYKLFSPITIKFPLYTLPKYLLQENYLSNDAVYNVETTTKSLFTTSENKLLFYKEDLNVVASNNSDENVKRLNEAVNYISARLKENNVKLIFLPSPDKYDFYYDFIKNKNQFERPLFFQNLASYKKDYIYVDSKKILSEYLNINKEIYFYGDTHWSSTASKIIANKISDEILNN